MKKRLKIAMIIVGMALWVAMSIYRAYALYAPNGFVARSAWSGK